MDQFFNVSGQLLEGFGENCIIFIDTFIGLSTESAELGRKLGVEFPEDPISYNLKVIDKLDPESTASMQKDLARGHDSEIQGLLFDMITAAEEQGIDIPTYRMVAEKFTKH